MRQLYLIMYLALFACFPLIGHAQGNKADVLKRIPTAAQMLDNSTQGREFWVAIPPNDQLAQANLNLEIYVTASKNATVTLEHPGSGYKVTKPVQALKITTFTTADETAKWVWEVREDEAPANQGIRVSADQPISVYVLNAKEVTSDGYLAIPTSAWDKDYIHCSFWDFNEVRDWAGGFIVIAKENATKLQIALNGKNTIGPSGRTKRGRKIGDRISVMLQRGQVYMVRGNATSLGEFDLTGSRIIANKPIGLVSFHDRTMIPAFPSPNNGRDHLCEMMPPVSTWGKQYVSIEMQRSANAGDMFRIVAKEKDTKFKCRYTDLKDDKTYTWDGFLKSEGDFMERENTWPPAPSIRGMAVWTATKPVLVMQYSYSAQVEAELGGNGGSLFDPAMCLVVPVEQYTMSTVFQTPSNTSFVNNYVNLLAVGDPDDPEQKKLSTVTIESQGGVKFKVVDKEPRFQTNRIPGTNIYWARIKLPIDAYHIYGETPFGATMYGFNSFASYYWPTATALNKIDVLDTLKPLLDTVAECGDYVVTATENRDQAPNAAGDSTQTDTGINQIEIDDVVSYNYALELLTDTRDNIHIDPRRELFKFRLRVIDKSQDAFAIYYVTDRAGNTAIDSVRYIAELVAMKPDSLNFGKVRLKTTKQLTAKIVNPTTRDIEVEKIWLQKNVNNVDGEEFKIINPTSFPLLVPAKSEIDIAFEYSPKKEIAKEEDYDIDSVKAKASCGEYTLGALRGQGVMPHIKVADWYAGKRQVNTTYCNTDEPEMLLVENPGTDVLTITDIKDVAAPFSLDKTTMTPPLPITIPAKGKVFIKTLCYTPTKTGKDELNVTFESDADTEDKSNDNVSKWTGEGLNPGPRITDVDFGIKRVKTKDTKVIELTNTGTFTLNVKGFKVVSSDLQHFPNANTQQIGVSLDGTPVGYTQVAPNEFEFESAVSLFQNETNKVFFTVVFVPQTETLPAATSAPFELKIVPTYTNSTSAPEGTAIGKGCLPHIQIIGDTLACIERGTTSQEIGTITVANTGDTCDLHITDISWQANSAFTWAGGVKPNVFPLTLKKGESRIFDVNFRADISTDSYLNAGAANDYVDAVVAIADTKEGNGEQADNDYTLFLENHNTELRGCDFTEGAPKIEVDNRDFEALRCDSQEQEFDVRNTGTRDLVVTSFTYNGNTAVYEIFDKATGAKVDASFFPFTVPAAQAKTFRVVFTPRNGTAPYRLEVAAVSNASDGDNVALLIGTDKTVSVKFAVQNDANNHFPGEGVAVAIKATSADMDKVALNTFTLVLDYDPEALRYTGKFERAAGLNDWNITMEADKPSRGKITITGDKATGADFVQEGPNGDFLSLQFSVYLSAKKNVPFTLSASRSDLGDRAACVIPQTENSVLNLGELCVRDLRGVRYSGEDFSLKQNTPNPVGAGEAEIEYSVAYEVPVKLTVYNMMGEEVKVLVDGLRQAGVYKVRIQKGELPSGTYVYRLEAGPYNADKQMVITK